MAPLLPLLLLPCWYAPVRHVCIRAALAALWSPETKGVGAEGILALRADIVSCEGHAMPQRGMCLGWAAAGFCGWLDCCAGGVAYHVAA
jgi:hypothetical protein